MKTRGSWATSRWGLLLLLLLLLPLPRHTHHGWALGLILPSQTPRAERTQNPPARYLSGPGQQPVVVMTLDLTNITKASSSFELCTWDPEGVIFYGDTNTEEDWFMLGLRDGRPEIQMHTRQARLIVDAGPQLDDGQWHEVEVKIDGDSVLLWVDGQEILHLRQVSEPLADRLHPLVRIALGGLLFPLLQASVAGNYLRLVPALDGCLRPDTWLGHQAQPSGSAPTHLRSCDVELQPGLFFPVGTHAEFSLQDIPQPWAEPWAFSLDLGLKLAAGSGHLLAFGTRENASWISLHLKGQKVELSSWAGPGLELPLVLGLPLQLKLNMSTVVLSQGPKTEVLALPPAGLVLLPKLWAHPQGRLLLGASPGEDSSASFCLSGLSAQGQRLDVDWALRRSQGIWTYSCPQSPGNVTAISH